MRRQTRPLAAGRHRELQPARQATPAPPPADPPYPPRQSHCGNSSASPAIENNPGGRQSRFRGETALYRPHEKTPLATRRPQLRHHLLRCHWPVKPGRSPGPWRYSKQREHGVRTFWCLRVLPGRRRKMPCWLTRMRQRLLWPCCDNAGPIPQSLRGLD